MHKCEELVYRYLVAALLRRYRGLMWAPVVIYGRQRPG